MESINKILEKRQLAPGLYQFVVHTPQVAAKALPGQFVIVMADPKGERIPLTIADYDRTRGTITLVMMELGTSTRKLARLASGSPLYALIGPLGHPSVIQQYGKVVMVAGGVGAAPIYPIAKALFEADNYVVIIQGARTASLLFWQERLQAVGHEYHVVTDDGSSGRKGLVTEPLADLLKVQNTKPIGCVYAIGPAPMMKVCCEVTKPLGVKTIVSLNPVMIDGTGMCGGCRVRVGNRTLFTCVDGPEFDGHLVDWPSVMARQRVYIAEERCSLERYIRTLPNET